MKGFEGSFPSVDAEPEEIQQAKDIIEKKYKIPLTLYYCYHQ